MSIDSKIVPQLHSTHIQLLYQLEKRILSARDEIESWLTQQWEMTPPAIYGSVDLRNAGYKLAPVDMNLFPAGFNNLDADFIHKAIPAAQKIIQHYVPHAKRILIIPENHTRNIHYWENLHTLQNVLEKAGFQVRFGHLPGLDAQSLSFLNNEIILQPLIRQDTFLDVNGFTPDLILLNNDLSEGIPPLLQGLKQPLFPPAEMGWNRRLKSTHFECYKQVVEEFTAHIDLDPWLICPLFQHCGEINFMQQEGMDCLFGHAQQLFAAIRKKYQQYNVKHPPFLVVKADAGTYGMAVMTVRNEEELHSLNRKQRTRMSMTKGGMPVRKVIIQEGVYTLETVGKEQAVAEPVLYLFGQCVVGGFYRVHQNRGIDENLNAPGMHFQPLAFTQGCNEPTDDLSPDASQNRFYVYGVVARLSMLAAAREIREWPL